MRALAAVLSICVGIACIASIWVGRRSAVYLSEWCALVGLGLLLLRAALAGDDGVADEGQEGS